MYYSNAFSSPSFIGPSSVREFQSDSLRTQVRVSQQGNRGSCSAGLERSWEGKAGNTHCDWPAGALGLCSKA